MRKCGLLLALLALMLNACASPTSPILRTLESKTEPAVSTKTSGIPVVESTTMPASIISSTSPGKDTGEANRFLEKLINSPCLEADPNIPDSLLHHNIIVKDRIFFYTLDLKNGAREEIKKDGIIKNIASSPDGRWLAYLLYNNNTKKYWISLEPLARNPDSEPVKRIPWEQSGAIDLYGWLNDTEIMLVRERQSLYSTVVVNILTGEQVEFTLDALPNVPEFLNPGSYYFANINILPDPDLKLVVYPQRIEDHLYVALRDQTTEKIIVKVPDLELFEHSPFWSTNGKDFIIAVATKRTDQNRIHDWFKVSRNGAVQQLTDFSEFLPFAVSYEASRSPDDRYLVFELWYKTDSLEHQKWLILDLETQKPLDFCISTDYDSGWELPIWSPDSRYLALGTDDKDANREVLLVDIVQAKVFRIAKNLVPVTWVSGNP